MRSLDIATGRSRKETSWANTEISWPELVRKLSRTTYTRETQTEYFSFPKNKQDDIKDVGGFVGGLLNGGRRKKGTVIHRSIVTLDADHLEPGDDPWTMISFMFGCPMVVYSTHKHTPESPRVRIVIPLAEDVSPEEYVAIGRKLADIGGINRFDDTTYAPERLMYWPSTSKGAEYVFLSLNYDEELLDPQQVLDMYEDWTDMSLWPLSEREDDITLKAPGHGKQEDPREKRGQVGAFCRTYDIHQAIEKFLGDSYRFEEATGRYTFLGGSTSSGVVVYNDVFAYSHHESDPAGGQLCNAFDLVRLHKFGHEDINVKANTPINRHPSYLMMCELVAGDGDVKITTLEERRKSLADDFGQPVEQMSDVDPDWAKKLDTDKKGNVLPTAKNFKLILGNDPGIKGRFARDIFEHKNMIMPEVPWRKVPAGGERVSDEDESGLRSYIEQRYGIAAPGKLTDALNITVVNNTFHPVRDWIEEHVWDGEERVETLLIKYQGAEDNPYVRAITKKTLVAAVARLYEPGIKYDYVLTLVGEEGVKKSSIIKYLGWKWFSDSFNSMAGKEGFEQLQGSWLIEMAELSVLKRAEVESAKQFITKQIDRYRPAYGKNIVDRPRQCIFVATTNEAEFLKSKTGNRRFWPVKVHRETEKDVSTLEWNYYEVGQIWAEAKVLYEAGEPLWLEDLEDDAKKEQLRFTEMDERVGMIIDYLDRLLPENWDKMGIHERRYFLEADENSEEGKGTVVREAVCTAEIWCECLGGDSKTMDRYRTREVNLMVRNIPGWEDAMAQKRFKHYGAQRYFRRVKK